MKIKCKLQKKISQPVTSPAQTEYTPRSTQQHLNTALGLGVTEASLLAQLA